MKKRPIQLAAGIIGVIFLFAAAGLYAAAAIPDVIKMQNKAYAKHTRPIVEFHHKVHAEDYPKKHPEFYKNSCGECHHDDNGKPLTDLKAGDTVKGCIECHSKPGELIGRKAKGLSEKELLEYHANALHDNCRGCHRDYNKANKLKSKDEGYAPTTCTQCHVK